MAKKKSKIHEHFFGVPAADDEGKAKQPVKAKKELPKDDIKNHSKFDKFKGEKK